MARAATKKVAIRSMTEDDIPGVLAIDGKLSGEKRALTYADPIQDYVGGEVELSWVAEVGGRVVGFILCQTAEPRPGMPKVAWIGSMGVDPDYQHQGIAGGLVKALLGQCRQMKLSEVHISANRHDVVLEGFFKFMGFRQEDMVHYLRKVEE